MVLNIAKDKGFTSESESKLDVGGFDAAHSASNGVSGKTDEEPKSNPTKAVNDESDGQDFLAVHWVLLRSVYNVTRLGLVVKYFF